MTRDGPVATITLNRPERRNAISPATLADREVRVIVLTGAGRGFCAGLELKDVAAGQNIGSDPSAFPARFDLRITSDPRRSPCRRSNA